MALVSRPLSLFCLNLFKQKNGSLEEEAYRTDRPPGAPWQLRAEQKSLREFFQPEACKYENFYTFALSLKKRHKN